MVPHDLDVAHWQALDIPLSNYNRIAIKNCSHKAEIAIDGNCATTGNNRGRACNGMNYNEYPLRWLSRTAVRGTPFSKRDVIGIG